MKEAIAGALMLIGGAFSLLAAVGILKFPDVFTRMQAATKSATLGVSCKLLAMAVYFQQLAVTTQVLLVIGFIFLTVPVAAHMIGRAAYFMGDPLWKGSVIDQLHGRYDPHTHTLKSPAVAGTADSEESGLPPSDIPPAGDGGDA